MPILTIEPPILTDWQKELHHAIHNPLQLLELLELPIHSNLLSTSSHFRLRVPRGYAARMHKRDQHDPLLRQVLPLVDEQQRLPQFSMDPLGETIAETVPGVLRKYHGRVLLILTKSCAIHCRYCFRQHYTYPPFQIQTALDTIRTDPTITEVILSGGDPLTLTDPRLAELANHLAEIPHLQRLRLHSRLPIVLPERVTQELLTWLTGTRLQPIIVVHTNHPNELDGKVNQALRDLVAAGVTVLNQSVLLHGVNDNAPDLIRLSENLFSNRVLPYYLHLLDQVQGAAHFAVPVAKATQIMEQIRERLPGYLVPKLVREVVGMAYKQVL